MNNIKFANFSFFFKINKMILNKSTAYNSIFAGMYTLIILVKDGFAGVEEIRRVEEEELVEKIKREVKRALKKQSERS